MLDRDTVIRSPHAATHVRKDGRTVTQVDDPRVSVTMQEEGATLALFFDRERAWAGDAPLLEVRLTPTAGGVFEPWRLLPTLPLQLQYARASLAHDRDNVAAALRALRQVTTTRRGLSDDFLRLVAELYGSLVAEGESYPVKALAAAQHVDKSTASRWVSAARKRGLLDATDTEGGNR
jgi:hypothetical protein